MLAFALRADGWWLRGDNIWHKLNPMPESVRDRPTRAHEYVFLLTKSGTTTHWINRDGGAFTAVRGFEGVPQRNVRFTQTWVRQYDGEFEKLDDLRRLTEAGTLTLRVAATYPPDQASEAHRRLEAGGTRGRLVIEF